MNKKVTKFIAKAKQKFGNKFDYSKVNYTNCDSKVLIVCRVHGEFQQTPCTHLSSKYGCPKCAKELKSIPRKEIASTINKINESDKRNRFNSFVNKARKKFGNKFTYLFDTFHNATKEMTIICPIHGEFKQTPSNHLNSKYGCKKCYENHNTVDLRRKRFIQKAKLKFNSKYDYSKVKYVDQNTKVTIICPIHGEFKQTPYQHLHSKYGCSQCAEINNKTYDFIQLARKKFGNKFDYSKSQYINNDTPVIIICRKHGEFRKTPFNFLQSKHGCPQCSIEENSKTKSYTFKDFVDKAKVIHGNAYIYHEDSYLNYSSKTKIFCKKHGYFSQTPADHINSKSGCPKCHKSPNNFELIFSDFLTEHNISHLSNNRNLISPYELDIIIPEYKIAIEYNGVIWHSFGKNYPDNFSELDQYIHLRKTQLCESKGYQLFHIFDTEWEFDLIRKEIWLSLLRNKLNLIPKDNIVYARKCQIRRVSNDKAKDFLDLNHLQGSGRGAAIRLGLYYQNELISLMTFGKPSISKSKAEYELIRFCSKINHRVIGGASKLFNFFMKEYRPKNVISYANRRWSDGNLYKKLGFKFIRNTDPNYFYFKENKLYSRNHFQKYMLKSKLKTFNPELSEIENMINNSYRITFDSGNKVYVYSAS